MLRGTGLLGYYAVFDGHSGVRCAEYAKNHLHRLLLQGLRRKDSTTNLKSVFLEAFNECDRSYGEEYWLAGDGSTALICMTETYFHQTGSSSAMLQVSKSHPSETKHGIPLLSKLHVAHIGDCRAVLGRFSSVTTTLTNISQDDTACKLIQATSLYTTIESVRLSDDHKPNRPDEQSRIMCNGGTMEFLGCPRVGVRGCTMWLAVSRAFGDFPLKKAAKNVLICEPEYNQRELRPFQDQFIVLASDGLWDKMQDEEVVNFVGNELRVNESVKDAESQSFPFSKVDSSKSILDDIAKKLIQESLKRGSDDNVTVLIIRLLWNVVPYLTTN